MLKPSGMSDAGDKKDDKQGSAAGGGTKKILVAVVAVNVLLAGGLGYVVLSSKDKGPEQAKAASKKTAEHDDDGEQAGGGGDDDDEVEQTRTKFGPLLEIGSFVANLQSPPSQPPRYVKVNISVEAFNEESKQRIEAALIPLKTEALMMLSNAKPEDVVGQEKMIALSEALTKRANKLIGKKSVKRVYFSELVVQ
jgi:flagellar basal body-associated protein FliL